MSSDCRNELVQRRRRGPLTAGEELMLAAHLASCDHCRMTAAFGGAFDELSSVRPTDGAAVQRLVATGQQWSRQRTSPRFRPAQRGAVPLRRFAWVVALSSTAAAAATGIFLQFHPGRPEAGAPGVAAPVPAVGSAGTKSRAPTSARGSLESVVMLPAATQESAVPPPPSAAAPLQLTPMPSSLTAPKPPTAASRLTASELLRAATAARREGQRSRALALYGQLTSQYGTSREGLLGSVAYGNLLLEGGQARSSLLQFERYLAQAPGGPLAAEALFGKASALRRLGRSSEANAVSATLSARYPTSPYASQQGNPVGMTGRPRAE